MCVCVCVSVCLCALFPASFPFSSFSNLFPAFFFSDKLGTVFLPVKSDINGNLTKIKKCLAAAPADTYA